MNDTDLFEQERPRLRAVAHRMLGSTAEADDAVQEAWLRLAGIESARIDNLGGWLTTVVARECLHRLRSRRRRREDLVAADPLVADSEPDPEQRTLLADSVGTALLIVLDRLTPGERLAFVLHDLFDVPFDEIADIVGRTPAATRQLASRARRRVNRADTPPDPDLARQRQVVNAFYAATRQADFDALIRVLDPEVVLHTDHGILRGAATVARQARVPRGGRLRPILINGGIGALVTCDGQPHSVLAFTVTGDQISRIDISLR